VGSLLVSQHLLSSSAKLMTGLRLLPCSQAGSVALIVLLILLFVGLCMMMRLRKSAKKLGRYHQSRTGPVSISAGEADMELDRLVENADIEDDRADGNGSIFAGRAKGDRHDQL